MCFGATVSKLLLTAQGRDMTGTREDRQNAGGQIGLYRVLPITIVYGVWHTKGWLGGGSYIAQKSCNSIALVGNADGEEQKRDDSLVHKSFGVNEYLVKAKGRSRVNLRLALGDGAATRVGFFGS